MNTFLEVVHVKDLFYLKMDRHIPDNHLSKNHPGKTRPIVVVHNEDGLLLCVPLSTSVKVKSNHNKNKVIRVIFDGVKTNALIKNLFYLDPKYIHRKHFRFDKQVLLDEKYSNKIIKAVNKALILQLKGISIIETKYEEIKQFLINDRIINP